MAKKEIGYVVTPATLVAMSAWVQEMIESGAEELQFLYRTTNAITKTKINIAITPDIKQLFKLLQSVDTQRVTAVKSEKRIWLDPTNFLEAYHQARMLKMEEKKDIRITNNVYRFSDENFDKYPNCWTITYWEKPFAEDLKYLNSNSNDWLVSYIDN